MKTTMKAAGVVLLAVSAVSGWAGEERTLTYWDEEIALEDVLYPAGVGEAEAEGAGIRLDPPALVQRSYDRVKVIWWMRYRAPDPDGLDEIRKAWEASLPEGVEMEIAVNPRFSEKRGGFRRSAHHLNEGDQKLLHTMGRTGYGRETHKALVEHFADPPMGRGARRAWEPTAAQRGEWKREEREEFARKLGVSGWTYRSWEQDRREAWARWLVKRVTTDLDILTWGNADFDREGREQGGWTPRILVQGRWVVTPNLTGGLRGAIRGANAAIAREMRAGRGGPPGPRSAEEVRRWLAGAGGLLLNQAGGGNIVWNEEGEEIWVAGKDMEVVQTWKRTRDGRAWRTNDTERGGREEARLWPMAAWLEAWPDRRRHPAMEVADRVRAKGITVRVPGGRVRLGPGDAAQDEGGRKGTWWLERGELRFLIAEREGAVGWRRAAGEVGYRAPKREWTRKTPWHPWVERRRSEEGRGHHSGAP